MSFPTICKQEGCGERRQRGFVFCPTHHAAVLDGYRKSDGGTTNNNATEDKQR